MAAARPTEAAVIVQSRVNSGADLQHIAPFIHVTTDSSTQVDIGSSVISYYFYIGRVPISYGPLNPTPSNTSIALSRLDMTYTGAGGLNANYVVRITVPAGTKVSNSLSYDVSFSLASNPVSNFYQPDDWSYISNTSNTNNPNILLQNNTGGTLWGNIPTNDRNTQNTLAQQTIKHIIVIMQENRSFDSYFATFPSPSGALTPLGTPPAGVDGLNNYPAGNNVASCNGTTYQPWIKSSADTVIGDLPHVMYNAKTSLGCPQNPSQQQTRTCNSTCGTPPNTHACTTADPLKISDFLASTQIGLGGCPDASFRQSVGTFEGTGNLSVLWNHWTIAQNFLLQDRMFSPVPSYSLMSHLFMVSAWTAQCDATGANCVENYDGYVPSGLTSPYGWNEISSALSDRGVSWGYYKGENWNYNCAACKTNPLSCFTGNDGVVSYWNPLPGFLNVQSRKPGWNGDSLQTFLTLVSQVTSTNDQVPSVSWIVPGTAVSEHPRLNQDLRHGEAYTTMLLQQMMKNTTFWNKSVVFLAWDDWGGFYDHVRPPTDSNGNLMYGIRVPGLTISPWLGMGALDHQTLSFDAYLKFIEMVFLPIGPGMPGQWLTGDARTDVRELEPVLGNLVDEFDFHRTPMAPPPVINTLSCQAP
jgi:phospholipase C